MKAIVQSGYGPPDQVLHLREIDKPEVKDDEVLVRVRGASVHPDVWHVVTGLPYVVRLMGTGLRRPKGLVPGTDLAGCIEAVGSNVTRFEPGDEVFGECHRGIQWRNAGAFAEYAAVPEDVLAIKPGNITFEQAAGVPTSGIIALINLRALAIEPGHRVLINGAGGNVGSIALQLAKAYGAHVTGVDSARKLDMMRRLGADEVVDYAEQEVIELDARFDRIFDVFSNLDFKDCKLVLEPTGIYLRIGHEHFGTRGSTLGSMPGFFKLMARSVFDRQLPKPSFDFPGKQWCMERLKESIEAGQLTPIVDRTYPLGEVVEAFQRMQSGEALGRIVLTP